MTEAPTDPTVDLGERATTAVVQLQVAGRALIAAARAALDVAESLLDDPAPLVEAAGQARRAAEATIRRPDQGAPGPAEPESADPASARRRRPRVEHIPVVPADAP